MWKVSEPEVWPDEFCECGTLRKVSLYALLSTLNLTGILCHLQQQLSYRYLYWILSKQEQLLHKLIIWQLLIIIVPHVYKTNRSHKPYKAFNHNCHCYIMLLYLIILAFYLLQFGFVPLFLYYHYYLIWYFALCSYKQNYSKITLSDITLLCEQGYIYYC
jgi:hypothetical protein